jgi:hypothetical protein
MPNLSILFNGEPVKNVITADTEEGFILKHKTDSSGRVMVDREAGVTVQETLRGNVAIISNA